MITVEELFDGEVSPWFVQVAREGDQFEVRGPFGGWFVWDASDTEPIMLIAGGSGLVPLMSMLRHRRNAGSQVPAKLLVSAREADDVLYARELETHRRRGRPDLHPPRARAAGPATRAASTARCCRRSRCSAAAPTSAARPRSWRPWRTTSSRSARHRPTSGPSASAEGDDGASRRQRGRGRAVRGLRTRCHDGGRDLRRLRHDRAGGPGDGLRGRHGHRAALPRVRHACCCATCAAGESCAWRCAASRLLR